MNYLTAGGLRLAYRIDGAEEGPPLVLLNSLGTDLRLWEEQVAVLGESFRLIRYDMRGQGQSESPSEPASIEQLGQDLLSLLDHLVIGRAHLCGLSLGGMVALWLAAEHPERVGRAVFANTAARIGSEASWEARIAAVREGGMAAIHDLAVTRFFSESFRARYPERVRAIGDMVAAADPGGYIAACCALRDGDLRGIVGRIRVPSLIIAGSLDQSTPPQQAEALHAAIKGSRLVRLEAAAHLSNVEQPGAFNAALLEWFALNHSL